MKQISLGARGPRLAVYQDGEGEPFLFQHGLCGDQKQPADVFPPDSGFCRVTVECRGHGQSEAGPFEDFSIPTFAEDVALVMASLGLQRSVVGGISMGAACALHLAVKQPHLVRALVIARPAWIVERAPSNMEPNLFVGDLLARFSPEEALRRFEVSSTALQLAASAPDNLNSLRSFFTRKPIEVTSALLRAIASDGPRVTEDDIRALKLPTLVIGSAKDSIHPLKYAQTLASWIKDAQFVEVTPKADDPKAYQSDFRAALARFLKGI